MKYKIYIQRKYNFQRKALIYAIANIITLGNVLWSNGAVDFKLQGIACIYENKKYFEQFPATLYELKVPTIHLRVMSL
jgi:hypothetical protein